MEWLRGVNKLGLLNLLLVSHYHRSNIKPRVVWKVIFLVHDGFLSLNDLIPITEMLIHRITLLLHFGLNLAKAFGRMTSEHDLTKKMKDKFKLVKNPHEHSITSISHPAVEIVMQIPTSKVMRKCHADEVPAPVVSLAA